jgi:hypothetical protein
MSMTETGHSCHEYQIRSEFPINITLSCEEENSLLLLPGRFGVGCEFGAGFGSNQPYVDRHYQRGLVQSNELDTQWSSRHK